MVRLGLEEATVQVFTFKEGLLSAVAHDLKLQVRRGSVELEPGRVRARLDARSLEVVTAMKEGVEAPSALPAVAHGEIVKNLEKDVLQVAKYPEITFETTQVDEASVVGRLTLHGVTREVRGQRGVASGRVVATFELDQRDFGIQPFSAMFGTLKVKPGVRVVASVPAEAVELRSAVA